VGDPDYAIKRVSKRTPYSYRVTGRFEGARGTGSRVEARVCNPSFVKQ
jgi:hypothetical protein